MFKKIKQIQSRYQKLENQLGTGDSLSPKERAELMKEYTSLEKIKTAYHKYQEVNKNIQSFKELLSQETEDQEFISQAKEELKKLSLEKSEWEKKLKQLLLPTDPLDTKNVVMEIRPAAGGDEASLFCGDLFSMYSRWVDKKNWKMEVLSSSVGNNGGFKEVIFSVSGKQVYHTLKYESGVHRVQRVPKTETQGRVHTSTVTVAVLPEGDDMTVKINPVDLRTDTFRSQGAGGQHVNTTDSAVRIVHLPTKITVQCQDEKSQHANKEKAMKVLYARLYDLKIQEKKKEESSTRLAQIGTGERSEKIRTYNFPQSRVTDHRVGVTLYNLEELMDGNINLLIEPLKLKIAEHYFSEEEKEK